MKPFRQVEATRRGYHGDAGRNSVHRSSLTVPEMKGAVAEVSFLNHFLIKRGYPKVACRITAVDPEGRRIEARLFEVTEPRVYTLPLTGMVNQEVSTYLVDFFAAENLFIPFPAVVVNHRGDGFLNSVHSWNRVLNDVFEDDEINAQPVYEASIDLRVDAAADTFVIFTAGPQPCRGDILFTLDTEDGRRERTVPVDMPRLTSREIMLREIFPELPGGATGTLRVQQPHQPMFFGRMLAGQRWRDRAFSANHSYYDTSEAPEYWDDASRSYRTYPFFVGLDNVVRMYPIMAKGRLAMTVALLGADGRELVRRAAGEANISAAPGRYFEVSVSRLAEDCGLEPGSVAAFALFAEPLDGRTPTRINHQLVYGGEALASSINVSLINRNVFTPEGKASLVWGQLPIGEAVETQLGLVGNDPDGPGDAVEVVFYGAAGELARRNVRLPGSGGVALDLETMLGDTLAGASGDLPEYVWYTARSRRPDLSGFTVTRHRATGHCTGEHSF